MWSFSSSYIRVTIVSSAFMADVSWLNILELRRVRSNSWFSENKDLFFASETPATSCLEYFNDFSACIQHFPQDGRKNAPDSSKRCSDLSASLFPFDSTSTAEDYKQGPASLSLALTISFRFSALISTNS